MKTDLEIPILISFLSLFRLLKASLTAFLSFTFSLQFLHFVFILFSILISSEQKSPSILNEFVHYTCLLLTTTFISLVFIRLSQCMFLAVNAKAPVVLIHALVRY